MNFKPTISSALIGLQFISNLIESLPAKESDFQSSQPQPAFDAPDPNHHPAVAASRQSAALFRAMDNGALTSRRYQGVNSPGPDPASNVELEKVFAHPPRSARPWVYWFFMDGNLTREGITADLEAMAKAGIGGAIYMEVGIDIPRGPVEFLSGPWRELLKHAFAEADRLGLEIALAAGPGWCGTGGPWVKPEQSMQHLVASETTVKGPARFDAVLPRPQPRKPFFGENTLTPELRQVWKEFYRDVVVLAFPTPAGNSRIADVDEKALYYRAPYSSQPGVKPYLPAPADYPALPSDPCIDSKLIRDLTAALTADGRLVWEVPEGNWTILRFGRTITGQTTRPAPAPGLGLESDKFDKSGLDAHFDAFIEKLLQTTGEPKNPGRGLTMLHFDSWEMSSQNWSARFREEFIQRRGYDPLRYLPAMLGRVVDGNEVSERFLWDLRQTANELVVDNHGKHLQQLARKHGLKLSLEPYDLNPCADLKLGEAADVPQAEFWSRGYSFPTEFSCIEAASIAHTRGHAVVAAEAFTALPSEEWRQYPGSMKAQGDWAFCCGINRFIFHRYQAQPRLDQWPGMTMGPYGVHWERTQTWWDLVPAYHTYLARCQAVLQQGLPVADILYLAAEGAPHVFRPPRSALQGDPPDRRGYNFDGCSPETLIEQATVEQGRIAFPDGVSYRVLVLPRFDTMTPGLLRKLQALVEAGANVIGAPPRASPSLSNYPQCDTEVRLLAAQVWNNPGHSRVIFDPGTPSPATAGPNSLALAKWIWHHEGSPAASAPVGQRYFRYPFNIDRAIQSAAFTITADNAFELFVNGRSAGKGDNFHQKYILEVGPLLQAGTNWITVTAENSADQPNPAGLIGQMVIQFRDGGQKVISTDKEWSSALAPSDRWTAALELGPSTMAPWNLSEAPSQFADVYPGYDLAARVLSGMGVPPDFDADGSIRYIHRRQGNTDVYFLANREPLQISATCRFRVTERQPEWWNPTTGERRDLPMFTEQNGITTVPVRFEALESGFVVFRKPVAKPRRPASNFPDLKTLMTLAGSWEVAFDPKWGGPERIAFSRLDDWSQRPEPGIKFYSGKAVYRTTFDQADAETIPGRSRCFLNLGKVRNLAAVKLNGRDLGTVWCEPWRVEIPAGLLLPRNNEVEITVANLWINRLIGDSALPENKRLTQTTWNPFNTHSPLQESGLLGPVSVLASVADDPADSVPAQR